MFHSAVVKLTAWYVAALCLVCLLFSLPAFRITTDRLRRGAERQTEFLQRSPSFLGTPLSELQTLREQQLARDRRDVLVDLLLIDVAIVGVGGVLSYIFAKRTLQPIESAHAAQARFTADASHELRTPLATIQTETEVALRNSKLTLSGAKQVLASNMEEVNRLKNLSDQLLSLTRATTKVVADKPVNIAKVIEPEIAAARRQKQHIETKIDKKISLAVPAEALQQLAKILLDNAVQYCDGKLVHVTLRAFGDSVELVVTNGGPGILPADLPHIFDRFYRGSNATAGRGDGHGLGLAIAKEIVESLHGEISAASKPGEQTSFTVTLPRAKS